MTYYELFSKLKFVTRYSGVNFIQPERLESHILEMCGLAFDLYYQFRDFDINKTLRLILLHDLDETITVDIPRPFKYFTKEFHEALSKNTEAYLASQLNDSEIVDEIINAKSFGLEGKIVRLLDLIQVYKKLTTEISLGNTTLGELYGNIIRYLKSVREDKDLVVYLDYFNII